MSMETGWPSIAASASIPPTPHPSTPSPLIIVVCESVPTRGTRGRARCEHQPRRDSGNPLQHHAGRQEGVLLPGGLLPLPPAELLDPPAPPRPPLLPPQQVFEQNLERVREARDPQPAALERVEPEDLEGPAANAQRGAAPEAVRRHQSTTLTFVTKYSVSPKQRVGRPLCCSYASATRLPREIGRAHV